jgi:hypothetical protein
MLMVNGRPGNCPPPWYGISGIKAHIRRMTPTRSWGRAPCPARSGAGAPSPNCPGPGNSRTPGMIPLYADKKDAGR